MSLIVKPPSFAYCTGSWDTANPAVAPGTTVTPSATANTDGTAQTLIPALSHDCEFLVISAGGYTAAAALASTALDILVDPAGGTSWSVLIDDLLVGYSSANA